MLGYLEEPEKTRECLTEDGWLHSGDIGYVDEDGYYYIVDRLKELIKYKVGSVAAQTLQRTPLTTRFARTGLPGRPCRA